MSFGGIADEKTAAAMFQRCREVGINFFDTANAYAGGRSEEILGQLIADCRDELVLTSKVGVTTGKDVNAGGLSRRHIALAVDRPPGSVFCAHVRPPHADGGDAARVG